MDELQEYAEHVREAHADAPVRRTSGCGCLGWGVGAVVLLLIADGAVHIWFPLLFVLIMLVVAGTALTLLINGIRNREATRGPFDPHNVDWHPLAVVRSARRESIARAAQLRTPPAAASPDPPPAAPPADPAVSAAAAGLGPADAPAPPEPAPDDAGPAATAAAYSPEPPEAPQAPETPDWA